MILCSSKQNAFIPLFLILFLKVHEPIRLYGSIQLRWTWFPLKWPYYFSNTFPYTVIQFLKNVKNHLLYTTIAPTPRVSKYLINQWSVTIHYSFYFIMIKQNQGFIVTHSWSYIMTGLGFRILKRRFRFIFLILAHLIIVLVSNQLVLLLNNRHYINLKTKPKFWKCFPTQSIPLFP